MLRIRPPCAANTFHVAGNLVTIFITGTGMAVDAGTRVAAPGRARQSARHRRRTTQAMTNDHRTAVTRRRCSTEHDAELQSYSAGWRGLPGHRARGGIH